MKHNVATYRNAGLEAKWGKTHGGCPVIFVRNPNAKCNHQKTTWWLVTKDMHKAMEKDGILEAFDGFTLLGDIFSVRA